MIFKQYYRVKGAQENEGGGLTIALSADTGIMRPLIGHQHRLKDSDPMGSIVLDVQSLGARQDFKIGEIFMVTFQHAPGISQEAYVAEQKADQLRRRAIQEAAGIKVETNPNGVGHD